ncbi:cholesterol 25-hydroxylase-like protein [Antennarius striatus]|uniref:cholesterol 25-hydroxylase-like protein n=1 Tax=Antennarius striatus TaxID=241820 RepID=UPI0035B2B7BB
MLLQPLWTALLRHSALLRAPLFPVSFSLTAYLCCCAPYLLLDLLAPHWPPLRRYRLEPGPPLGGGTVLLCLCLVLQNHLLFILPLTLLHWYLTPAHLPAEAPPLPRLLAQVLVCLLVFDLQSFVWHLLHHRVTWLYRRVHKVHHTFSAPSAPAAEYSSAWETLSLGLFAAATPPLLGLHPLTRLVFFWVNVWLSVEAHCGYDLPWAPHRLLPLGLHGGAPHHHLHHLHSSCNYAPYFTHWDRLAGTLRRPRPHPELKG